MTIMIPFLAQLFLAGTSRPHMVKNFSVKTASFIGPSPNLKNSSPPPPLLRIIIAYKCP